MKNKDTETEEGMTITFHNVLPKTEAEREDIKRVIDDVFDTIFEKIIKERDENKSDDTDDIILPKK